MFGKTITTAAFALAIVAAPALAQTADPAGPMQGGSMPMGQGTTDQGSMGQGTMGQGAMGHDGMGSSTTTSSTSHKMTKRQMATMQRCQAMSSDMMMKNKACTKLQKTHPDMTMPPPQ